MLIKKLTNPISNKENIKKINSGDFIHVKIPFSIRKSVKDRGFLFTKGKKSKNSFFKTLCLGWIKLETRSYSRTIKSFKDDSCVYYLFCLGEKPFVAVFKQFKNQNSMYLVTLDNIITVDHFKSLKLKMENSKIPNIFR